MSTEQPLRALRAVALFEALKGAIVFGAAFGMLALLHRDLRHLAEGLISGLHLNPDGHRVGLFVEAAARVTDARLWTLSGMAFAYSALHGLEAWGLWSGRTWAEWLAVVAGGLYLPVEAWELAYRPTPLKALVLVANLGVVLYLLWALQRKRRLPRLSASP